MNKKNSAKTVPPAAAPKKSAMKLPPNAQNPQGHQPGGRLAGKGGIGGKPHKTPEHLMGKSRKVH